MTYFKNDFLKWHMSFVVPYTLTFIAGLLRSNNALAYQLHPVLGMLSVALPLTFYLLSKNKKLIRGMIKSNFNYKGKPVMKLAKLSTQIILVYFAFSVFTGVILNNSLYGTPFMYNIFSSVHGVARYLVPLAMLTHIATRLIMKRQRKA